MREAPAVRRRDLYWSDEMPDEERVRLYQSAAQIALQQEQLRQMTLNWFLRFGKWRRWFAWWPVDTECGRVWLRWVMRARPEGVIVGLRDPALHLTVPGYVGYRLDGKIAG